MRYERPQDLEAVVKKDVRKVLTTLHPKVWYFMPQAGQFGARGVPDFVVCCAGRSVFIECKSLVGRLTKYQELAHEEITRAGGVVFLVRGSRREAPEQYDRLLEQLKVWLCSAE